jgi:hypothetical protein
MAIDFGVLTVGFRRVSCSRALMAFKRSRNQVFSGHAQFWPSYEFISRGFIAVAPSKIEQSLCHGPAANFPRKFRKSIEPDGQKTLLPLKFRTIHDRIRGSDSSPLAVLYRLRTRLKPASKFRPGPAIVDPGAGKIGAFMRVFCRLRNSSGIVSHEDLNIALTKLVSRPGEMRVPAELKGFSLGCGTPN